MTALSPAQAATVARAVAADNHVELDADALDAVVARLTVDLGLADDRSLIFEIAVPFEIKSGKVVDALPLDHAREIIRAHGKPTARPARTPPAQGATRAADALPISTPQWARESKGPLAEFAIAQAAAEEAKIIEATKSYRNPWLPGQINRTHQVQINKYNLTLAAKYKAEAGI